MMKIITIFSILFTTIFYSQNKTNNYKYGFINENGTEITAIKYDKAYSFSEGMARVSINGKWGFINKEGQEITPIKYDTVYTCKSGVARIKLNGKYGLIDVTGKEITAIKYDNIGCFDFDVACVKINGKWGIINIKGEEITALKYDYMQQSNASYILCLKGKDKMTLIDENKKPIEDNPLGYFSDTLSYFDETGIAKVCMDGKWGFIDKTGKEISEIKYDYVFFFSEGMARVLLNGKWGFINEFGMEVIPLIYYFSDKAFEKIPVCGNALSQNHYKPVYIDKAGNPIIYYELEFFKDEHTYFNHGLVSVHEANVQKDNVTRKYPIRYFFGKPKYVFLDKKGEEVTSKKYDSVANSYYNSGKTKMQFYHNGLRKVEKNERWNLKYGFADTLGNMIIPFKYEFAHDFNNGVAQVRSNSKSGLVNKEGNEIASLKYDSMWEFRDGIARVNVETRKRKWGIINTKGEELTAMKYDFIWDFENEYARVELDKKIGFIDKSGKEVIKPKYSNGASFSEGYAEVVYNGKVGFIDKTGEELTLFKYDETQSFRNGFARVRINNKWSFIDKNGKEITPIKYDAIDDFEEGLAVVKKISEWYEK